MFNLPTSPICSISPLLSTEQRISPPYSPWPLGGEQIILHLVLQGNEGSDGVEERQPVRVVDHQLQVPHQHSQVHGPTQGKRQSYHPLSQSSLLCPTVRHTDGGASQVLDQWPLRCASQARIAIVTLLSNVFHNSNTVRQGAHLKLRFPQLDFFET